MYNSVKEPSVQEKNLKQTSIKQKQKNRDIP